MPSSVGVVVLLLLAFGPAVVSAPIGAPGHGDSNLHPDVSPFVDAQSGTTNVSLAAVAGDTIGSPPAPTDLVATPYNTTQIDLTWTNPIVVPFAYTTVALGDSPAASSMAYDSRTGQVFVSEGASNVAVISDSTNTVVLTIGGFNAPSGLAYDSALGEVYVVNFRADTVSVVSDVTDTITATINVGMSPSGITYDSGLGEMFVANAGTNNVSVIDDATNTIVTSVDVGNYPTATVYDPLTSEVYVSNEAANTVSVIADATNTVIATTTVGSIPLGVAYDAGTSQVFVANWRDHTVSILSDATHLVVGSVGSVGMSPYQVAYDAALNEVFVGDGGASTVSVLSDITDTLVAKIPVGDEPYGMVYDSGAQHVFVANSLSNNVSVLAQFPLVDNHVYVYSGPSCTGTPAAVDLGLVGTAYPDAGLSGGTAYSYTVTASNSAGESANSSCANATTFGSPPAPAPPAQPSVSAIAVSNSEVDLIWNDSSTLVGSDHATLNEYSGASCSGSGTAVDVQTGNWGFQNFTALTPATVYSFNVTITDSGGTSAASACAAATTRAQTLDPFGAVAQGNTTISLPTVAGQRIILLEGISDALPGDSQGNSWSYVQDGNTGNDALWTAVTATTGTDVITTGTSPPSVPYTGGWAVAVSGELKTIVASGQAGAGVIGDPYWAKLPAQAENTVAVFTEPVSGGQNESCQFTVPVGVPLSCTPILAGAYGDHRPAWRFPAFVYDVPAGIAPVVSGNLTAYGNTLNSRYVPVFDFFWVELAWPVPAAPTGLTATPVSSTVVDLAWTNPAGPLTGNNVTEWAGSGCTGGPLDTFAMAPGTVAVRGSLAVGTTYSYSVTASNVSGVGANSACADATTFDSPPAPTDLVATPYNTTQIDLTWVNPVGPLDDLNVTTYAGSGCVYGDDITNAILGVITAYDWTGLVPNSPYSFTVNAENSTGWSAPSDCASATTPPVPPTLTVANVTFYTFNESWTAGNWTNVTGAYLVLTFNASICGSVVWGDTTNSYWTWAVYTGGGEVNKTVSLVKYEFNFTRAFNLTFGPGETVYVGLVIETSGGDHPTAFSCQAVAFTPAPPPGPCQGTTCNIFPLIMLGVVAGVIIFAVTVPKYDFWRKERQRGMGGKK